MKITTQKINNYLPPDFNPQLINNKFNMALNPYNSDFTIANSSLYTNNINPSFSLQIRAPQSQINTIKPTKILSSNMITPDMYRKPYIVGERIGEYSGNKIFLKNRDVVLINGQAYKLPQPAVNQNAQGNGIGIFRFVKKCIEHPESVAKAKLFGVKPKNKLAQPIVKTDSLGSFLTSLARKATTGFAIKGEVNIPGLGLNKFTLSFGVNNADFEKLLKGELNFGDVVKRGGVSFTLNKVISQSGIAGGKIETSDTTKISFGGGGASGGRKELFKGGLFSLEIGAGATTNIDGLGKVLKGDFSRISPIVTAKGSIEIPGSRFGINKALQTAILWARNAALASIEAPFVAGSLVGLGAVLTAIAATQPYVAAEFTVPVKVGRDANTGKFALSTVDGTTINGTLPQIGNTLLKGVGFGQFQMQGGLAQFSS